MTTDEIKIKELVNALLDSGMKDKSEIYSKIVEEFGTPRPTARRIVRNFREEMIKKVKILESDVTITGRGNKVG